MRLRPSTAVDKTVFQCTKFWIGKEVPMWVVEAASPGGIGIIWGVLVFIFNFGVFLPLRGQFHEFTSRLFDSYLRFFSSLWSRCHVFFDLRPDSSSGVAPLLELPLRSKRRGTMHMHPRTVLCCVLSTGVWGRSPVVLNDAFSSKARAMKAVREKNPFS